MSAQLVLARHQWRVDDVACTCGLDPSADFGLAAHQLEELRDAGYAVVKLPDPEYIEESGMGWQSSDLNDWGVYVATADGERDGRVYDQNEGVSPAQARLIGSWWLAAADAAEVQS